MPTIRRSALVEHSAARMFDLVNDIDAELAKSSVRQFGRNLAKDKKKQRGR